MKRVKNVTISLDEGVARWARVWAAQNEMSLSRLVATLLEERMRQAGGYERAMKGYLALRPVPLKKRTARYPSRDQLHDRTDVR